MGYIKEPKGVDFIIQSEPLKDEDRDAIRKFIAVYKTQHSSKRTAPKVIPSVREKTTVDKEL